MKASVHLREGPNQTNMRSEALADALESFGVRVERLGRGERSRDSDLVIQTGFARSEALLDAIEREVPYIIMEMPHFRDLYDPYTASSWGYNGLAGGAWRPTAPDEPREKPLLKPMKREGKTLIIGQKPTDHSLRGDDHVKWILERRMVLPEADFRPHPLMVPPDTLVPLKDALQSYGSVCIYTSTAGLEALVEGLFVTSDSAYSLSHGVTNRREWLHDLSWGQGIHSEYRGRLGQYILSGYDEALARAEAGLQEIPRGRVDGRAICERYYSELARAGIWPPSEK